MSTIKDEFELLKAKIIAGKGQETIHVVYHEQEKKRKRENPTKSTRMIIDCRSPELWSAMQMEKERYITIAVDPALGIELMVRALRQFNDAILRAWLEQGEEPDADAGPPPERAQLPEWLR